MKYAAFAMLAVSLAVGILTLTAEEGESAFHHNRIYAVMGGADGDASVQYVELRMSSPGQGVLGGHDICFFDEMGEPWARFTFPSGVSTGAMGSSILVGSPNMDAQWPAGTPDFTFGAGNTTAIAGGAAASAPVHPGSGKVAFGSDSASDPGDMCDASFNLIDSVAYGIGYTGGVDYPPAFASDLPTAGTQAIELVGPLCDPGCQENSTDYEIGEANPRNNDGDTGPLGENGTSTPTPTPTPTDGPTGSPTPTATDVPGVELVWADVDCGGGVNSVDALKKLQYVAAIPFNQEPNCPMVGAQLNVVIIASGEAVIWGDANCDGDVNAVDALQTLRHIAALGVVQEPGCPEIGGAVQVVP